MASVINSINKIKGNMSFSFSVLLFIFLNFVIFFETIFSYSNFFSHLSMILIYSTNTGNLCLTSNDPSAVSGVYKQLMLLIRVSNESSPSVRLDTVVIILILLFWIFCLKH